MSEPKPVGSVEELIAWVTNEAWGDPYSEDRSGLLRERLVAFHERTLNQGRREATEIAVQIARGRERMWNANAGLTDSSGDPVHRDCMVRRHEAEKIADQIAAEHSRRWPEEE